MKGKIILLILGIVLICTGCGKKEPIESLYRDAEKLEANILKNVNTISQCRSSYEKILLEAEDSEFAPLACYKLGKLNEIFGHYDEAIDYYKKLLSLYPEHPICADGLLSMAQIYQLHLDKNEEAMAIYQQLVTFYPDQTVSFEGYLQLGQRASRKEDWKDAVAYFEKLVAIYPQNEMCDDLYFRIGDILQHKLEEPSQAKEKYKTLIEKYPNSTWIKYSKERLAFLNEGGN